MDQQDFLSTIIPSSMAYPGTEITPRYSPTSLPGRKEQFSRGRGYRGKIVVGCLLSVSVFLWAISPRSCGPANHFDPVDGILRTAPMIGTIIVRLCQTVHAHAMQKMATMTSQSGFGHFTKTTYTI